MSLQCAQVAKKANGTWSGSGMVWPAGAGQWFFPCAWQWWGRISSAVSISWPQFRKDTEGLEHIQKRATRLVRGLVTSPVRSGWGSWGCLSWRRGGSGGQGGVRAQVGLDDLQGLFQPCWFCDSLKPPLEQLQDEPWASSSEAPAAQVPQLIHTGSKAHRVCPSQNTFWPYLSLAWPHVPHLLPAQPADSISSHSGFWLSSSSYNSLSTSLATLL